MLCLMTVYKDISQNMHFDVVLSVFIHPCSKKWRRAQFSIRAELTRQSVCVRFRCVRGKLFTQRSTVTPTIPSIFYACLVPSGSPYIQSCLIREIERECTHALAVMHRRTLCENVDSAKIKVPFYTTDIDILRVASMHRIVIHCIDISMNRYTPDR